MSTKFTLTLWLAPLRTLPPLASYTLFLRPYICPAFLLSTLSISEPQSLTLHHEIKRGTGVVHMVGLGRSVIMISESRSHYYHFDSPA